MTAPARLGHRTLPLTALQVFWSVSALVGLFGVGCASLGVAGPSAFWRDVHGTPGALTVSLDLVLLAVPVLAFAVIESRRLGMRMPWVWIPLAVPLPGAFVVPLFFLLRERALLRRAAGTPHQSAWRAGSNTKP